MTEPVVVHGQAISFRVALADVVADGDPGWFSCGLQAVRAAAATGRPFELAVLREPPYALPDPPTSAHWGALARRAVAEGLVVLDHYGPSEQPSRRGSLTRYWTGNAISPAIEFCRGIPQE